MTGPDRPDSSHMTTTSESSYIAPANAVAQVPPKAKGSFQRSYSVEVSSIAASGHPQLLFPSQNGYQGKTRSLVGDAKFETMVRRDTRKNLLMENSAVEKEEEDDEAAKEDEVFLLESLQDEPANSKVSLASALVLHVLPGEADDPDQADGLDQRPGPGGQDGRGGGRAPHPRGDQGAQAGLGQ